MSTKAEIVLSARDETRAAFDSANKSLSKMSASAAGLTTSFGALAKVGFAGISLVGLAGLVKSAIDAQDNLKDLSKATAISIEDLAGLSSAALRSGSDLESIAGSINKLSVNMGKEPEKFKAIGISTKDPIEAFKQLADVFNAIQDPQERAAFGAAALGKSWAGAAPLLAEGSKAIGEMVDKGKSLSKITAESAAKADELNDQLVDLKVSGNTLAVEFAKLLVPSLNDTAKAMNGLMEKGSQVLALLRGFAGLGKLAFDIVIPPIDMTAAGQVKDLEEKLATLQSARAKAAGAVKLGGTALTKNVDNLDSQIAVVQNQIAAFKKFGDKTGFKSSSDAPLSGSKVSPDVRKFIGSDEPPKSPKSPKTPKATKEDPYTDLLTPAAEAYAKAIESINAAMGNADKSTLTLNASQEVLYDLMNSQAWQDMPDAWKEVAIAQSQAGTAAIETADNYKRLKDLLDATPTAKLEETRSSMILLADAFEAGKISAEQFSEAAQTALGTLPDEAKEATDAMSEFAVQAAHNMQDAFADFLFDPFKDGTAGMLEGFGTALKKMIANAVAADLSSRIFGKAGGGEGSGLLGAGMDWLKSVMPNADGGVYNSPGLSAYSGTIVSRPTIFPFAKGIGLMGEAGAEVILPLQRGANGQLGVTAQGGSGHTINVYVQGTNAPDVRRAAGQGAREAMAAISGGGRYR